MHGSFRAILLIASVTLGLCRAQTISTVAGGGLASPGDNGPATATNIIAPSGVAVDSMGNLYFIDTGAWRVRKVDASGIITTIAGDGNIGLGAIGDGGPATQARFLFSSMHEGIAVDSAGNVYVTDSGNYRVRKIDTNGVITTFAGNGFPISGGDGGPATGAGMSRPSGLAIDSSNNVYIAESTGARVRKVDTNGIITTVAGNGSLGFSGDGGLATKAAFNSPIAVAVDTAANLYIADQTAQRVRKVTADGIINTVVGSGSIGFSGDGGSALKASFSGILGISVDGGGAIYIADSGNKRVRKVDSNGTITTVAGNGSFGTTGDGGPATSATLNTPNDVAVDSNGALYISDRAGSRVRKVSGGTSAPSINLVANAFGDTPLIAPNTWVELKGSNLAPAGASRIWQGSDFAGNKLPTQLDGISVSVDGKAAYVYFISPTQVNILTPPDAISGAVQVQLSNGGLKSNTLSIPAQPRSLSFFEFVSSTGKHYVYGRHAADSSLIGPASLYPGLTTPVKPGESIFVAATGFGPTDVPVVSGSLTQSGSLPTPLPVIKIGGIQADVSFAGLVSVGTYQINFAVPPGVPDGDNPITATYEGLTIQPNLLITVQH